MEGNKQSQVSPDAPLIAYARPERAAPASAQLGLFEQKALADYRKVLDRGGDIVDQVDRHEVPATSWNFLGEIILVGAGVLATYKEIPDLHPFTISGGAAAYLAAKFMAGAPHRRAHRRRVTKDLEGYAKHSQKLQGMFDNEPVDVFNDIRLADGEHAPRGRVLTWREYKHGSDPAYLADRFGKLSEAAEVLGAQHTAVTANYVSGLFDEGVELPGAEMRLANRLAESKPGVLPAWHADATDLRLLSNDELRQLAARARSKIEREEELVTDLDRAMEALLELNPRHPARRWYIQRANNPDFVDRKLHKQLKGILERGLRGTDVRQSHPEDPPEKLPLEGKIKGNLVQWRDAQTGQLLSQSSLHDEYSTTPDKVAVIVANYKKFPKQAIKACELAAWQALDDRLNTLDKREKPQAAQPATDNPVRHSHVEAIHPGFGITFGTVERTGDSPEWVLKFSRSAKLTKFAGSFMLSSFVAAGIFYGGGVANLEKKEVVQSVKELYPGLTAEQHAQHIQHRIDSDPLLYVHDRVIRPVGAVNNWFKEHLSFTPPPPDKQDGASSGNTAKGRNCDLVNGVCEAGIGNVDMNSPNIPDWRILARGGMDSTGYWTETVYDIAHSERVAWIADPARAGKNDTIYSVEEIKELPVLPMVKPGSPMLEVSQAINVKPEDTKAYARVSDKEAYVPVPILANTKIIGASMDDAPGVRLVTTQNHTPVLLVPAGNKEAVTLSYWLAPDTDNDHPEPHLANSTHTPISGGMSFVTVGQREDAARTAWQTHTGYKPKTAGFADQNIQAEKQYIGEKFDYRLSPLQDPTAVERPLLYPGEVLASRKANCNTTASLMVMSNPSTLNYTVGYLNKGQRPNGKAYLSSHESHAWALDVEGTIHDATPGNNILPEEAAFFEENFDPEPSPGIPPALLYGGALALVAAVSGGTGLAVKRGRDRYLATSLTRLSAEELKTAGKVLDHTWAAPTDGLFSFTRRDLHKALHDDPALDAQHAREAINNAAGLSKQEVKGRLATVNITNRTERAAVHTTERVLKLRRVVAKRVGDEKAAEMLGVEGPKLRRSPAELGNAATRKVLGIDPFGVRTKLAARRITKAGDKMFAPVGGVQEVRL